MQRVAGRLRVDPCIPRDWPGFSASVRSAGGTLEIDVENPEHVSRGVVAITVDGTPTQGTVIELPRDGAVHRVCVRLGEADTAPIARGEPAEQVLESPGA